MREGENRSSFVIPLGLDFGLVFVLGLNNTICFVSHLVATLVHLPTDTVYLRRSLEILMKYLTSSK